MALLTGLYMKKATLALIFLRKNKFASGFFKKLKVFTYLTKGLTLLSRGISPL